MSEFFSFDSGLNVEKSTDIITNQVIYEDTNPDFYILIDDYLKKSDLSLFKKLLKKFLKIDPNFKLVYSFKIKYSDKQIKKNILNFVLENGIELTEYIPPNSKVLAIGRSLYTITKDTDIQLASFQEIVWNKTYFYAPEIKSWIFPVCSLNMILNFKEATYKDTYDSFHFEYQLNALYNFEIPKLRIPQLKKIIIEEPNKFLYDNMHQEKVAWDLETGGFDCRRDEVRCITMSFDGKTGYYLRFKDIDHNLLNKFFESKYQIGANLKFDCRFMHRFGITNANPDFDTLHAGHCLNEMRSNSLKTHAWLYTYYGGYDLDLELFKRKYKNTKSYLDIPESIMIPYATMDPIITFQVYEAMVKHLADDEKLENYFYTHVMPTVKMFTEIESQGVFINWSQIEKVHSELKEKQDILKEKIQKIIGSDVDINSSKQLGIAFKEKLKLPNLGFIAKDESTYLTGEEPLKRWSKMGYKIADLILEYRGYSALLNTFVGEEQESTYSELLGKEIDGKTKNSAYWEFKAPDGKIYPNFRVMLAKSHRNKAHGPNLQQVPHHGDKAWMIRSFFDVPSEDFYISEFDYSGFQLRIAAILSKDENMKKVFTELGGDLHSMTAQAVFCPEMTLEEFISKKNEALYKEFRFDAKGINCGYLFGMQAFTYTNSYIRPEWTTDDCRKFIAEHGITNKELQKSIYSDQGTDYDYHLTVGTYMRKGFFSAYSSLEAWHESQHSFAEKYGYVRTTHGARRHLPQLLHIGTDKKLASNLKNISINSPVQNFEIVVISRAMREFHNYCKENNLKSRLWATVHDAVAFYIHKDDEKLLQKVIPEIMTKDYPEYEGIPIEVEGDLSDPRNMDKNGPTYWGYGKDW